MAAAAFGAAAAPGPITLALAIAAGGIASGVATSLAQASLVDQTAPPFGGAARREQVPARDHSAARARTLARWTLVSVAGDLAVPGLLAALSLIGASWRAAYAIVGAALLAWLVALCVTPATGGTGEREDSPPLLAVLRDALRDRTLVAWLFGTELCHLLDEILVVFASLHLRLDLGASALAQSAVIAMVMLGDALGLIALDRLLRARSERSLLAAAALGCAIVYAAWLAAPSVTIALALALPVGMLTAPLYPLAAAQTYAARPGQSGSVLAAGRLFTPLSLALPWLIGAVADRAGTTIALALLVAQPLGLLALVAATRVASGASSPRNE